MKKIFPTAIVIVEFLFSAYVAFCGYFLSSWFINDSAAVNLAENDWNKIAAIRVLYATVIALFIAVIFYILNKYIFTHYKEGNKQNKPIIISSAVFFMIIIPAVIGAIEFAIKRPYM